MPDDEKIIRKDYRLVIMNSSHIKDCAEIFIGIFLYEPWNYNWLTFDNVVRYFNDLLNSPSFQGFVYQRDGIIDGVCLGVVSDYFYSVTYDIKEIFMRRELQDKGIGSTMLNEIETVLASKNINAITLFTQRHIPAYNFYVKNGYQPSDEIVYFCKPLSKWNNN